MLEENAIAEYLWKNYSGILAIWVIEIVIIR